MTWLAFGSRLNAHSADSSMIVLVRQLGCDVFATIDKKWARVAGMSAYPSKETSADARFTTKKSRHDGLALGDLFAAGLASAPGAFGELRNDTTSQ